MAQWLRYADARTPGRLVRRADVPCLLQVQDNLLRRLPAARQASLRWVSTEDLPTSARHPFFERLNRVLEEAGFGPRPLKPARDPAPAESCGRRSPEEEEVGSRFDITLTGVAHAGPQA